MDQSHNASREAAIECCLVLQEKAGPSGRKLRRVYCAAASAIYGLNIADTLACKLFAIQLVAFDT